jgi:hypothetical protein
MAKEQRYDETTGAYARDRGAAKWVVGGQGGKVVCAANKGRGANECLGRWKRRVMGRGRKGGNGRRRASQGGEGWRRETKGGAGKRRERETSRSARAGLGPLSFFFSSPRSFFFVRCKGSASAWCGPPRKREKKRRGAAYIFRSGLDDEGKRKPSGGKSINPREGGGGKGGSWPWLNRDRAAATTKTTTTTTTTRASKRATVAVAEAVATALSPADIFSLSGRALVSSFPSVEIRAADFRCAASRTRSRFRCGTRDNFPAGNCCSL